MCHRFFLEEYHKIDIIFKLIAMIEEILFILHVVNGIHIIIPNTDILYLHDFQNKY